MVNYFLFWYVILVAFVYQSPIKVIFCVSNTVLYYFLYNTFIEFCFISVIFVFAILFIQQCSFYWTALYISNEGWLYIFFLEILTRENDSLITFIIWVINSSKCNIHVKHNLKTRVMVAILYKTKESALPDFVSSSLR